jgi:HEAT repeat protein
MILTTDQDPGLLVLSTLKDSSIEIKFVAAMALKEIKTDKIAEIAAMLPDLENPVKVAVLAAFAGRCDLSVHDQVVEMAQSGDQNVRVAAVRALAVLGNEKDIMLLASLAVKYNDWESAIIRESLAQIKSPEVNASMLDLFSSAEPKIKIELIGAIRDRNVVSAVPVLLKEAQGADPQVRIES